MTESPEHEVTPAEQVTDDERAAAEAPVVVSRWAIHRHLYDWMLGFAHRPHATTALFVFSFIESSFFPIPPDVLLGPMCLGNRRRSMWFALITTAGSVCGAFLGYYIGYSAIELVKMIPGVTQDRVDWLAGEFEHRGSWYVFVAALTPIPFKLLTITAGFAKMNLLLFVIACAVGRAVRFFGVAAVFWMIGPKAVPFIDKWFNWLCVIFVLLLVGGFVVAKMLHGG
ncbi:MAG: DedA family protein [Phycisphaera sp.]|nr:DedA family protein [Phycisphaera sp.]